ncbi:MAG: hypothetical protein AAF471_09560 [Myxococcota bacterium]
MKVLRYAAVAAALALSGTANAYGQFCEGFKQGYQTGYMQASGRSVPPIAPVCPVQPVKRLSDPNSDFEHGYSQQFSIFSKLAKNETSPQKSQV